MYHVVVPSNREDRVKDWLKHWTAPDVVPIIVEDGPQKSFAIDIEHHYSWAEIDADLKDKAWIISRRDGAVRCYGFLVAHRLGAEYTFTLDDDCYPIDGENLFESHIGKMEKTPVWAETVTGTRTRGLPYQNRGTLKNVVASVGLWTQNADVDGVQALSVMAAGCSPHFFPEPSDRLLPAGQYFPLSSMNLAFNREVAPLMLFPLSGEGYPFRRFDDIWWGIIFKRICDHLRLSIAVGSPYVRHVRASDPFLNLVKEAPGIQANEHFWEMIDGIELRTATPRGCMLDMAGALRGKKDGYLEKVGLAMANWVELVS